MRSIIDRIQEQLTGIEAEHNVRVLYAVESGSRAWGFASADSDYDVRFLFVRPVQDYLRIRPMRDVIELPIVEDLDTNGWDAVKALTLFQASNPALLEWLSSPIVYREIGEFADRLRDLAETHASPRRMAYHYLSMAKGQFGNYIEGKAEVSLKKYLYVLRPLFCLLWLEHNHVPPPTAVHDLLEGVTIPGEVAEQVSELLDRKRAAQEREAAHPIPVLDAFCQAEITRFEAFVPSLPSPTIDSGLLDALFHDVLDLDVGS